MRLKTILRRAVWTLLVLATLIALFYAEENWRGTRALAAAERDYRQVGSLNYSDFIPPALPDDQNLAALPIFAEEPDPQWKGSQRPLKLEKALRMDEASQLSGLGSWQAGEKPDLQQIRRQVAIIFEETFKGASLPLSSLEQFAEVFPLVKDLNRASLSRPECRFPMDYGTGLIQERPVALLNDQIALARILTVHAILALNENQPKLALDDMRTLLILRSGVSRDPSLAGHLIGIVMVAISEAAVTDGLALHSWSDADLAQLGGELQKIDYLANYRLTLQGRLAGQIHDLPTIRNNFVYRFYDVHLIEDIEHHFPVNFPLPWPPGWANGGAARLIRFSIADQEAFDPTNRRVQPERCLCLQRRRELTFFRGKYILPWDFYFSENSAENGALLPYARAQAWVDHSVIACALERFRIGHGSYPETLDALSPSYLSSVPRDFMNGEPYHYRLNPDGSYVLYSVGWNEKDDGGTVVFDKDDPQHHHIDYDQGDWVWFGAK